MFLFYVTNLYDVIFLRNDIFRNRSDNCYVILRLVSASSEHVMSNCREECMPDTKCEQCLVENCGKYTSLNDMPENPLHHA